MKNLYAYCFRAVISNKASTVKTENSKGHVCVTLCLSRCLMWLCERLTANEAHASSSASIKLAHISVTNTRSDVTSRCNFDEEIMVVELSRYQLYFM